MSDRYEAGTDADGRIYCDVFHNGRLKKRYTSNGERPFTSQEEAISYMRKVERAKTHALFR